MRGALTSPTSHPHLLTSRTLLSPSLCPSSTQAKQRTKAPFSEYASLEKAGVTVAWGNPADKAAIPAGPFDVIYDNNGKDLEACQPLIDAFKVCGREKARREV